MDQPVTDLERAMLVDAGEPCVLVVGDEQLALRLSGLDAPRPLARSWPVSDVRHPAHGLTGGST